MAGAALFILDVDTWAVSGGAGHAGFPVGAVAHAHVRTRPLTYRKGRTLVPPLASRLKVPYQ